MTTTDPLIAMLDAHVTVAEAAGSRFYAGLLVWPYLPDEARESAESAIRAAGERATADAPLALVAFEGAADEPVRIEIHLTLWPGGERRLVAVSSHHPITVEWLAQG